MPNTHSSRGKYLLAALLGVAAGGVIVALSTRCVPNMMSGMMAHCKRMMAGMAEADGDAGEMCQDMIASKGQAPEHATCGST